MRTSLLGGLQQAVWQENSEKAGSGGSQHVYLLEFVSQRRSSLHGLSDLIGVHQIAVCLVSGVYYFGLLKFVLHVC